MYSFTLMVLFASVLPGATDALESSRQGFRTPAITHVPAGRYSYRERVELKGAGEAQGESTWYGVEAETVVVKPAPVPATQPATGSAGVRLSFAISGFKLLGPHAGGAGGRAVDALPKEFKFTADVAPGGTSPESIHFENVDPRVGDLRKFAYDVT